MAWSVNVDIDVLNKAGAEPNCRSHRDAGWHYDVTVHPPLCPHHGKPRAQREKRYWRDFATEADAMDFAAAVAAQPIDCSGAVVSVAEPILIRTCRA